MIPLLLILASSPCKPIKFEKEIGKNIGVPPEPSTMVFLSGNYKFETFTYCGERIVFVSQDWIENDHGVTKLRQVKRVRNLRDHEQFEYNCGGPGEKDPSIFAIVDSRKKSKAGFEVQEAWDVNKQSGAIKPAKIKFCEPFFEG